MRSFFLKAIIIFSLCIVLTVQASAEQNLLQIDFDNELYLVESNNRFLEREEPTVALVLGGGGARAFINIGVIKALEEEDMTADMIVGTSMGAVIGTMYGSGVSAEQIEEVLNRVPFEDLFDLSSQLNKSLLETKKVNKFIEDIIPNKRIENFPIPTALLSFDLNSGHKYLNTKGKVSDVLQSSYAIPFYFPIEKSKTRYLIDPGILEMSPAKAAKVLGADFIIATTAYDNLPYQEYNTSLRSAVRFLTLVQQKNSKKIINKYADIVINTGVGNFSFMDFEAADRLIKLGYKETKRQMDMIKEELNKKNIKLDSPVINKNINYTRELNDLKYNRQILSSLSINPLLYYGQDYSIFSPDLLRSSLDKIQYGFELEKGQLELITLVQETFEKKWEVKTRWKKISKDLDLLAKSKFVGREIADWKLGVKYYADNYTFGLGHGNLAKENCLYLDNSFDLEFANLNWQGENNILFPELSSVELLAAHKLKFDLSSIWTVIPKFVYNSSNQIAVPVIYRGIFSDDNVNLQGAIDFVYTHQFLPSVELAQIFQLTNLGMYSFIDYQSNGYSNWATGLGLKADFNLLGLKPLDLRAYTAYSLRKEEFKQEININYNF